MKRMGRFCCCFLPLRPFTYGANRVTVLALVGGAPAQCWGGRHRASPIHRRRARAASFITAYLLSRTALASPPEQCATFARSISLSRDFPQATLDRGTLASVKTLASQSTLAAIVQYDAPESHHCNQNQQVPAAASPGPATRNRALGRRLCSLCSTAHCTLQH